MSEDRINLSSLDPARAPLEWELCIARVASEGLARRRRPMGALEQIQAWLRPAVAVAAVLALLAWSVAFWAGGGKWFRGASEGAPGVASTSERDEPGVVSTSERDEPALVLAKWALVDARPSPSEILNVLGGGHVTK